MVAASAVLPFGVLHGFMRWFNGDVAVETDEAEADYHEEYEEDDESDLPRTIRINGDHVDDGVWDFINMPGARIRTSSRSYARCFEFAKRVPTSIRL